ncbi:AAA family ATPase [Marinobacter salinisoli]|uniref:AAA family ATPase n=1 Tax=Marinobacter salinisoli TaxID=2769486 RepID=A0ABX7MU03_9GAMM|nr:AAA family ATPase [Marinobacter salinisoli]QSP93723.1 AAA family ATPase [Marinobacter salinisoli]
MYYDFFGFREPPFSIAPDPRYLYLSERHKEALAHLMYGVKGQGGFIVITGEVGTGKTTISRCFIENAPDYVDIALILNPRLSARELLSSICSEMEIPHRSDASVKIMVDLINTNLLEAHAAGRHKVLLIDEAQNLSADVLEQLRLLTNLETAEKKLLQIVLLGQPELQQILGMPELRQLNQRVTARYHLDAIGKAELHSYLRYRLGVAGVRGDVFSPRAVSRLYQESSGIPRLINLISDRALLGAYAEGEHEITAAHIRQAAREVRGNWGSQSSGVNPSRSGLPRYLMLAAMVLLLVIGGAWWYEESTMPEPAALQELAEDVLLGGTIERPADENPVQKTVSGSQPPGAVRPASDSQRAMFEFNADALALSEGYRFLFQVWGRKYQPDQFPNACEFALSEALGCLERQGTRRSLEFLDRPALLELQEESGQRRYLVLETLIGDVAEIRTRAGTRKVSFASIEPYWFGSYKVLWSRPSFMDDRGDGARRGEQLWLGARMMELADKYSSSISENARVKRMNTEEQVRWYQNIKGLSVDGIAGAMTIIQINNDLGAALPRLVPKARSGKG